MRRQRRHAIKQNVPKNRAFLKFLSIIALLVGGVVALILFLPISLNMHLSVTDPKSGDISIYSFEERQATVFVIPGETTMMTAGDLGEWPAKSLWKLGHDEKQGGALMSRSITKTFGIPVTNWAEPTFINSLNEGLLGFAKILTLNDTNLSVLERINLSLASIRGVSVQSRSLEGTSALEEVDDHGEKRFIVRDRLPVSFTTQFDEESLSKSVPTVGLFDGTDSAVSAQWIVKLVNVVGGRVVSRDRVEWDETCEISGEKTVVAYFMKILPCKASSESAAPFDVKIKLGKNFTQIM